MQNFFGWFLVLAVFVLLGIYVFKSCEYTTSARYAHESKTPEEAAQAPIATLNELHFYDGELIYEREDNRHLLKFYVITRLGVYTADRDYRWVHLDPEMYKVTRQWDKLDWATLNLIFQYSPRSVRAINTPEEAAKEPPITIKELFHYNEHRIFARDGARRLILVETYNEHYVWLHLTDELYAAVENFGIIPWDALNQKFGNK